MKAIKIIVVVAAALLVSSVVFAMYHTAEDRGKALFNDGTGLNGVGDKKMWKTPGGEFKTLEEAVNICITMALKGKALDVKSEQMKDIVSYLKSLKPAGAAAPAKKPAVGC